MSDEIDFINESMMDLEVGSFIEIGGNDNGGYGIDDEPTTNEKRSKSKNKSINQSSTLTNNQHINTEEIYCPFSDIGDNKILANIIEEQSYAKGMRKSINSNNNQNKKKVGRPKKLKPENIEIIDKQIEVVTESEIPFDGIGNVVEINTNSFVTEITANGLMTNEDLTATESVTESEEVYDIELCDSLMGCIQRVNELRNNIRSILADQTKLDENIARLNVLEIELRSHKREANRSDRTEVNRKNYTGEDIVQINSAQEDLRSVKKIVRLRKLIHYNTKMVNNLLNAKESKESIYETKPSTSSGEDNVRRTKAKNIIPHNRIKTIWKSVNPKALDNEGTSMVAMATELFLRDLIEKTIENTIKNENGKLELNYDTLADIIDQDHKYEFLKTLIPKRISMEEYLEKIKDHPTYLKQLDKQLQQEKELQQKQQQQQQSPPPPPIPKRKYKKRKSKTEN